MELQHENRILVKEGLKRLNQTKSIGMRSLIASNKLDLGGIKAYHIGFVLGPCLNASGRLDTAKKALLLLKTKDEVDAGKLAEELVELNTSRKALTGKRNRGCHAVHRNTGTFRGQGLSHLSAGLSQRVLQELLRDASGNAITDRFTF